MRSGRVGDNKKYGVILCLAVCMVFLAGCQGVADDGSATDDKYGLHVVDMQVTPGETELAGMEAAGREPSGSGTTGTGSADSEAAGAGPAGGGAGDGGSQERNDSERAEPLVDRPDEQIIEGFTYIDGQEVPVSVTLGVESILKGEEAYGILQGYHADITPPGEDEEYIIVTFRISYDEGGIEQLDMMENRASLADASLYFALSNSHSNAGDVTLYLNSSIYDIVLEKGGNAQGAVAFLQEKGNTEPMVFVGFGQNVRFYVNEG